MNLKHFLMSLAGLAILFALLAVDRWIFVSWFHTTHLKWYLTNGALIGITSSIASLAWGDLNRHVGLISANPFDYLGSHLQLVGLPIYSLGTHLKSYRGGAAAILDLFLTTVFLLGLMVAIALWLFLIVPLQYFLYLFCGAPARTLARSKRQSIARLSGTKLEVNEIDEDEKIPAGWWSASINQKPLAITNVFVSLFFLIAKPLLG